MPQPLANLKTIIKNHQKKNSKIAVCGIGNELRGDDAAGILVAEELCEHENDTLKSFLGGSVPENVLGTIIAYNPALVIFVDAAHFEGAPGTIKEIALSEVDEACFSTHTLPISLLIRYLQTEINTECVIIGIQPENMDFDAPLSKEVSKAIQQVVDVIVDD